MPIQVPKEIIQKLKRMSELNIITRTNDAEDEHFEEYSELLPEMVEEFQSLMEILMKAGLFSVVLDREALRGEKLGYWDMLDFDVCDVFENGNLCMLIGGIQGVMPKQEKCSSCGNSNCYTKADRIKGSITCEKCSNNIILER